MKKQKKLYVVTTGEYSDKQVRIICETREMAEKFCEKLDKKDVFNWHDEITEYNLNEEIK